MSGKKFRVSLHSILTLRRHETEQSQRELVRIRYARQEQEACVESARRHLDEVGRQPRPSGTADPRAPRQQEAFRQDALRAYENACSRLDELHQQEAEARAHLMEKHHAEDNLQKLYAQEEHQQAQAEADLLDEHAALHSSQRLAP